ncbi:Fanconi anemia group J protein homolog [Arctopsyche grandis]|uniref:Fanconi anemia group J protein homolog n=1 Tax=Arctopsyche grandis TaxID=121162 RepID=UPI00406DA37B
MDECWDFQDDQLVEAAEESELDNSIEIISDASSPEKMSPAKQKADPQTGTKKSIFTWLAPDPKKKAIYIDSESDNDEVPEIKIEAVKIEDKPALPPVTTSADVRIISGVKVEFPVKPYGPQIALMDKVIKGITKGQNCLLESPTGSGKTLALLCSALAWQQKDKERVVKLVQEARERELRDQTKWRYPYKNENVYSPKKDKVVNLDTDDEDAFILPLSKRQDLPTKDDKNDESCDVLVNIHKRQRVSTSVSPQKNFPSPMKPGFSGMCESHLAEDVNSSEERPILKTPKIFFGTRTHKQLGQVIKEFKKTVYAKSANMTILSSREHTCIRDMQGSYLSKTEMCRDILQKKKTSSNKKSNADFEEGGCRFKKNLRKLLNRGALPQVWDIEELVEHGRMRGSCPYFAARELIGRADIVFCPYNYLIDPLIKSSMSIDIADHIILLDEAHNIEDVCRDAASLTLERKTIQDSIKDLESLLTIQRNVNHEIGELYYFKNVLNNWMDWFENHTPLIQKQYGSDSNFIMSGNELAQSIQKHGFDFDQFGEFQIKVTEMLERLKERSEDESQPKMLSLSNNSLVLLEAMCTIFSFFYRNNSGNFDDYRGILVKKEEWEFKPSNNHGWNSKSKDKESKLVLNVICMNPAVIFSPIEKSVRSIILSSGTLTPTLSFAAELGAEFPIVLQTGHVISSNQVWVGSVTCGENGLPMEATFRNTSKVEWQDALGKLLLWICENVPHGVLCFLPSYRLLDVLRERWRSTRIWDSIEFHKSIFSESKKMKEHDEIMSDFYSCVGDDRGALLFAVFRGKVSEGMDFRDHQARAVVSVGIPYPNIKDSVINSKMKYNDSHRIDKGLLSGGDWLQVQAYRALNQALGRCIRHRNDWGAVIMVDSRFNNPSYTKHVSKWVRNFLAENHHNWESLTRGPNNLCKFMDRMSLQQPECFNV